MSLTLCFVSAIISSRCSSVVINNNKDGGDHGERLPFSEPVSVHNGNAGENGCAGNQQTGGGESCGVQERDFPQDLRKPGSEEEVRFVRERAEGEQEERAGGTC